MSLRIFFGKVKFTSSSFRGAEPKKDNYSILNL